MADTFTGGKYPQKVVEQIFTEIYLDAPTLANNLININDGFKSSSEVTESATSVAMQPYSVDGVDLSGAGSKNDIFATVVNLNKFQFDGKVLYNHLEGTRFEKSIAAGAMNYVSSEFDQKVLINIKPAIAQSLEQAIWNGATTAQKAAVAGLTAGAGQGALTAAGKAAVAAMPTNQFNSIPATIIYNSSNAKVVAGAGLGDYRKVLSPATITSANIAAEYLKLYETHFAAVSNSSETIHKIFAPLGDKALMVAANKGATTVNPDFVEIGGKFTYNGYEVIFVPLSGFRIMTDPLFLLFLTDLSSDAQSMEQQRGANLADFNIWKTVMFGETFPVNQKYITIHGA
jgi:hypothetical protein